MTHTGTYVYSSKDGYGLWRIPNLQDKPHTYELGGTLKWGEKHPDSYIVLVVKYKFYGFIYSESTVSKLNVRNVKCPSNRGVRYVNKVNGLEYRHKII